MAGLRMRRTWGLTAQKWLIWIAFFGALVALRHLFPVIFLTFVLTYIGNTLVSAMTNRLGWRVRRLNLAIVFVLFLLGLIGVGILVVPKMFGEARQLALYYVHRDAAAPPPSDGEEVEKLLDRQARRYVDLILVQFFGRESFVAFERSNAYEALIDRVEESLRHWIPKVIGGVGEFVNNSIAVFFQFLLAIVLSFLILWDLPALRERVKSLARGRTSEIYEEIAPSMTAFGVMLGRAFEAQTGIAVVNAVLTSIGFMILGIPSIALLATIVFFCSYIPVVGVMLSTLPAALFAFKTGGITLVIWLVVMILVVHAVEAYALNPIIYGRHMKMHPVAILVILMIGEHLFGVWGLLLGVPIAAFVWTYVVGGKAATQTTPANPLAELSPPSTPLG